MWAKEEVWEHQDRIGSVCVNSWRVAVSGKGLCEGGTVKKCDGKSGIQLLKAEGGGDLNLDICAGGKVIK